MTTGTWLALLAIAATVLISVIASYVALSNKLTRVETKVDSFSKRIDENREDHQGIWTKLDNHETRISKLEPSE
jgi:septal ring factor EnvC (AmiA/AmiB activator)